MNAIYNLCLDLKALHHYKIKNKTGFQSFYLDTIKNIIFLPSVWFLIIFRFGQLFQSLKPVYYIYLFFIWRPITVITQIEIYPNTIVGGGLVLPHFGQIFVNPNAKIGNNCLIFNNVTIGCDFVDVGSPIIGDNVMIGVGAKIIGKINVSSNSRIKANQVIATDI